MVWAALPGWHFARSFCQKKREKNAPATVAGWCWAFGMIRAARAFRMISAARHSATASWARCPLHFRHLTQRASTADWNQEWSAAGLGAKKAPAGAVLNRLLFVQTGFGCDQHGDRKKGCTKAAVRAVRDAISFNSIPGMVHAVPGGRDNMLIHLKLGLPLSAAPTVDLDEVASCFPYGKLLPIEVVEGGLTFGCGRVVPELGERYMHKRRRQPPTRSPRPRCSPGSEVGSAGVRSAAAAGSRALSRRCAQVITTTLPS